MKLQIFCLIASIFIISCNTDQIKNTQSKITIDNIDESLQKEILSPSKGDSIKTIEEKIFIKETLEDSKKTIIQSDYNQKILSEKITVIEKEVQTSSLYIKIGKYVVFGLIGLLVCAFIFGLIKLGLWVKKFFI